MLRGVDWYLFTDVSGQPIFFNCLTLEDETDMCPDTSVNNYQSTSRNNPEGKELTSVMFFDHSGIFICASYLLIYQIPNNYNWQISTLFAVYKNHPQHKPQEE